MKNDRPAENLSAHVLGSHTELSVLFSLAFLSFPVSLVVCADDNLSFPNSTL